MIKCLPILGIMIFMFSCASKTNNRKIAKGEYDGLKYESLSRYDQARLKLAVAKGDPLAMCHAGNFDKATDILKKQLDTKSKSYDYWNQISTCYIIKKDYNYAKRFLSLALGTAKTNKQRAVVYNNYGVTYLENNHFEQARDYFKKAISLNKDYLTPKYNLTQIYLKFSLYSKAHQELVRLLSKNSRDIDFMRSMAHLKLMQKKYKSSLEYFGRIPIGYQTRDDIATNKAMALYMLGDFENAKKTIEKSDKKDSYYTSSQAKILEKIELKLKAGKS